MIFVEKISSQLFQFNRRLLRRNLRYPCDRHKDKEILLYLGFDFIINVVYQLLNCAMRYALKLDISIIIFDN